MSRALLALSLVLFAGCTRGGASKGTGCGVLIIAIDGLRADHLSSMGYDRETTPMLDALAQNGVVFTQCYAQAPLLLPSHIALLSGCDPLVAKRYLPDDVPVSNLTTWSLPENAPNLAREFLSHGYTTACFADDPELAPVYGLGSGFSEFQTCEITESTRPGDLGIDGIGERFGQWLKNRGHDENWFAYVHLHDLVRALVIDDPRWDGFFQPRASLASVPPVALDDASFFAVPRAKWGGSARTIGEYEARYDGAVRKLDKALGRLFGRLKDIGRFDDTTACVIGTYGIGFGEAGLYLDSGTLADVDLHVPLIVHAAASARIAPTRRIDRLVGAIDLAPTLLELGNLDPPGAMQGSSFAPLLRGRAEGSRSYVVASHGLQPGWVVIDQRHCLERTYPGRAIPSTLARSWFGDMQDHSSDVREVLHDRDRDPAPSHLHSAAQDDAQRGELAKLADEWFARSESLRARWQSKGWLDGVASDSIAPPQTSTNDAASGR